MSWSISTPCAVCKVLQRRCTEGCVMAPYFSGWSADKPLRFTNMHRRVVGAPCAACNFLQRKCTESCVFAPYFPAEDPMLFADVQLVFGASNVEKMLNGVSPEQRKDVVKSLSYEACMRLSDPVHGCVGHIFFLQERLYQIHHELVVTRKELAAYVGPTAAGVTPFYYRSHQQPSGMQMGMGLSGTPTHMLNPWQQRLLLWESAFIYNTMQQSRSNPPSISHWPKWERDT